MRTPRTAGAHAWISPSFFGLSAIGSLAVLAVACSAQGPETETSSRDARAQGVAENPEIQAFARSIKARFPIAFAEPEAPESPSVTLPRAANEALRLRDEGAKFSLDLALDGAKNVPGAEAEGLVVYRGAAPDGGDLVHRRVLEGVEDLVLFERAPSRERLSYQIRFGADRGGAAGLRLVNHKLEILDRDGAPIFRARAPYVVDASGRHDAELAIEGCAYDTSLAAPFRRPIVEPGAAWCTVTVDWSKAGVRYPALVDPFWNNTFNTMATPRAHHTLTLLNPKSPASLALVTGGVAVVGGAPLKSAEIYDPLSRRFSDTGDMNVARTTHTATLIVPLGGAADASPQPVLVAGGADAAGNPLGSLEVYHPASGTFVLDSHSMATPRFEHAAELAEDNTVLIAGGTSPPLNQPTNTGYLYTFTAFDAGSPPPSVQSSLAATPIMSSARTGHAMTRTNAGPILVTGGYVLAGGALQALQSAELFDPAQAAFGPIVTAGVGVAVMTAQRGYHSSTALGATGNVLVVGGLSKTVNGIYTNTADLYADGTKSADKGFIPQASPIAMATARANHSATLLPDNRVVIAGGFGGAPASALNTTEVWSPTDNTFTALQTLVPMQARGDHAALLVNAGDSVGAGKTVLVTGGSNAPNNGSQATAGAQYILRPEGEVCENDFDCLSGFCTDGVCCLTRCDDQCLACRQDLKQANDPSGTCGPSIAGTEPRVECINQVETHTVCDGLGSTQQVGPDPNDPSKPFTHSCKPAACDGDNLYCSKGCNETKDCDESGWCDTSQSTPDFMGTCVQKKALGAPCGADDQCVSLQCVDHVCCNSLCDQQCQACDLPGLAGQCTNLGSENDPQDVHPNGPVTMGIAVPPRDACAGFVDGVRTACTGACRGVAESCTYPGVDAFLHDDTCADDEGGGPSKLTTFPCDMTGSYTENAGDCGGYRCADGSTCRTTCAVDEDCINDFVCIEKACVKLDGPLCDGTNVLRQPKSAGGNVPCPDNYACPSGATACLTSCESVKDCVTPEGSDPIVCAAVGDGPKQCVTNPAAPVLPGCAMASGSSESRSPYWLAALGLSLLAIRRRRR